MIKKIGIVSVCCLLAVSFLLSHDIVRGNALRLEEKAMYTFKDDLGRQVSVGSADRVVAMLGSYADLWLLAGGELKAAARDAWTDFDLELPEEVVNIGALLEPDLEKLLSVSPDLVIASAKLSSNVKLKSFFEDAGITVAYFDVSDFEDYLRMLKVCTEITGRPELYERYGDEVARQVEQVRSSVGVIDASVLYLNVRANAVSAKDSSDNVGCSILKEFGCRNIADSDSAVGELSVEAIVSKDPDYIFISLRGNSSEDMVEELFSNPAWAGLRAVKDDKVFVLDKELYSSKPNARWGEAYEKLADMLNG